jgi:hypothetical protein
MITSESDTTFEVRFTIESSQVNWQDSVRRSFETMVSKEIK